MDRERRISYDGKKVQLKQTEFNVYMLDKIQGAIEEIKKNMIAGSLDNQANVSFSLSELQLLRRLLIIDDLTIEFCRDNMLEGVEIRDKRKLNKN